MRIQKISLQNFRQFYGNQEIVVSDDPVKNVTLIHAENGYGKTTILNAVLWSLFQKTTTKFERPKEIVNFEALRERRAIAKVDVLFEQDNILYEASRSYNEESPANDRSDFTVHRISENGTYKQIPSPTTFVETVIPAEMAKYFFFDGEAAETFAGAKNFKDISDAIKNILGSTLAKTAIADLKELEKVVGRHLTQIPGQDEIARIETSIDENVDKIDKFQSAIAELEDQRNELNSLLAEINDELRNYAGARQIQESRDRTEALVRATKAEIKQISQEIVDWIGKRSLAVISRRLTEVSLEFIDEQSLKGKIPSPYNEEFVKGLLRAGSCICDRELKAGTEEWRAVNSLLSNASNAEMLRRVINSRARISTLKREAYDAPKSLERLRRSLALKREQLDKYEHALGELSSQLKDLKVEKVTELETARQDAHKNIQELSQQIGSRQLAVTSFQKQKKEREIELQRIATQNTKACQLVLRRQLLERSREFISGLLEQYEEQARQTIEKSIAEILQGVAHRPYRCLIDKNFAIDLQNEDGISLGKSSGENQLLSLLFIGALIQFAAARIKDDTQILKPGTIAPLVLDAPFGNLDPFYQRNVAHHVPRLANQVVLLVSSSQGNPEVLEALEPFVGAEYVLISENRGEQGDMELTKVRLHEKEYITSVFDQPRSMTRIDRIR